MITIGTAAWSVPKAVRSQFPSHGPLLQRYAAVLPGVEINSTFYRSHKPETFARWAATVPTSFRFAVKMRKTITHDETIAGNGEALSRFFMEIRPLDEKLGPVLVQLPPSLSYDKAIADRFFISLREQFDGDVAFEPRHPSWFSEAADALLKNHHVSRVAVDPKTGPNSDRPGGFDQLAYFRLHGAPEIYFSDYSAVDLQNLALKLRSVSASKIWCIFDNTGFGYATSNALAMLTKFPGEAAVCSRAKPAL